MEKPFRLRHKGAILNLQGCKQDKQKKEKSLNTLNLRKTNPFSIIPCKTNISNIKKDISKSFYRDDLGHFNYDTSLNYDPHEHFS